ncbi:family 43 glycosylhydrolase [Sphingomonas sp. BK235]|uniref:family 43 glycosylhydrolase n=1 Tax=Sphingomonas sp. BK235 TaxID=2512131 RepID=UPI0010E34CAD|nr:family 43 glycosylhydrolase [Sphingomonas sp. BK235]TCP37024.1 ricin-type beta-trefoil lectin protein [Sphingomonas sp. BK235]
MGRGWIGLGALAMAAVARAQAPAGPINNGSPFTTVTGEVVQAHGAGVIKVGAYYYLLGENRDGYRFKAVSMYRSTDLRRWEFRRDILTSASAPSLRVANVERPKVIYNAATRRYVLWAHKENGENYNEARVVVATSDTVDGDYVYQREFRPLDHESRDMTLFVDDDGSAYLISAAANNYDLNIYRLTEDYTAIAALVTVIKGYHREAPALFKRDGTYFLVTSGATGWNPNRASYQTAAAMAGPWTAPSYISDPRTYNSQPTFVLPVTGSAGTSYLYLGDRWAPATGQQPNDSTYVWLPLTFPTATSVELPGASQITVDTAAGTVALGHAGTTLATLRSASRRACARVADQSRSYEAGVIASDCRRDPGALVEARAEGADLRYVFQHSGLCLAEAKSTAEVVQTDCTVGTRAAWSMASGRLLNRASGRCLVVAGDPRARGGKLVTEACGSGDDERWILVS